MVFFHIITNSFGFSVESLLTAMLPVCGSCGTPAGIHVKNVLTTSTGII